jgi:hypothetical protein
MDMQGTPIGSTHKGMKASIKLLWISPSLKLTPLQNTTDPRAKHEIQEAPGPVASDSLAAESFRAGGGFSENRDSEPLGVKGANSTFANEDTSGATTLPASKDAPSRNDEKHSTSGPGGAKYAEAPSGGQPSFPGAVSDEGSSGGSSAAKQTVSGNSGTHSISRDTSSGDSKGPSSDTSKDASSGGIKDASSGGTKDASSGGTKDASSSGTKDASSGGTKDASSGGTKDASSGENRGAPTGNSEEPHVDPAPTYVQNVVTHHGGDKDKPKGKNLTEGFEDEDDAKNASMDMRGEPGDENDPGRASVKQFQATTSATIGSGPTQKGVSGDSQYKALDADESLE